MGYSPGFVQRRAHWRLTWSIAESSKLSLRYTLQPPVLNGLRNLWNRDCQVIPRPLALGSILFMSLAGFRRLLARFRTFICLR